MGIKKLETLSCNEKPCKSCNNIMNCQQDLRDGYNIFYDNKKDNCILSREDIKEYLETPESAVANINERYPLPK